MLSAFLMFRRFIRALRVAAREEGFWAIGLAGLTLIVIGTLTYTFSQDWSLVDGLYFAIATLTTSSIADPSLTLNGSGIKLFTIFYILIGIGILVELVRQLGFAFVEVKRLEREEKHATKDAQADR